MLNTPEERHAFIIGLSEVICPWPPHYNAWPNDLTDIRTEYHYYMAGRAISFGFLLFLAGITAKIFLR